MLLYALSNDNWLFCLLGFYVPLENFSLYLYMESHSYRWRAANVWPIELLTIKLWRFFNIPHNYCVMGQPFIMFFSEDLWPVTCDPHTCCRAFSKVAVTTCIKDFGLSQLKSYRTALACKTNAITAITDYATAAANPPVTRFQQLTIKGIVF